ncbi:MAG: FtsW/RodA/SpoVE family cell cycle protein, partial [Myxococcota bacterium]
PSTWYRSTQRRRCRRMEMLPVVGLTLPLVSYGGSSVITVMLGIALLVNISIRRHLLR